MGDGPVTPFCWRDHGWRGGQGKTEGEASKSRWPGGKLGYLVAGARKSTPDMLTSSGGVWWLVGLAAVRPRPEALAKPQASVFLRLLADEGHLGFWLRPGHVLRMAGPEMFSRGNWGAPSRRTGHGCC